MILALDFLQDRFDSRDDVINYYLNLFGLIDDFEKLFNERWCGKLQQKMRFLNPTSYLGEERYPIWSSYPAIMDFRIVI